MIFILFTIVKQKHDKNEDPKSLKFTFTYALGISFILSNASVVIFPPVKNIENVENM